MITMRRFQMTYSKIAQEWPAETAFIVAGGPSVRDVDLELLRGRNVIVINSSVHAIPWAQFLYFGDYRWYAEPENRAAIAKFSGRVITTSKLVREDPKVLICHRTDPPGLAREVDTLVQKWTSLTAATNLAAHLVGPGGTIVWLGADGKHAVNGRTHHHDSHPWPHRPECFEKHRADLATIIPSLREWQISAFNASPGTAWGELLPVIRLDEWINDRRAA